MSKAADIYWDNPHDRGRSTVKRPRRPLVKPKRSTAPWWVSCFILTSIFIMLCVSINFRAISAIQEETDQNAILSGKVQSLLDENLALQEEIHLLRTDPDVIEREARRLGIGIQNEKVPVPAN